MCDTSFESQLNRLARGTCFVLTWGHSEVIDPGQSFKSNVIQWLKDQPWRAAYQNVRLIIRYNREWSYVDWSCHCWPQWRKTCPIWQKSSSLRNPWMWHINRSVLRCCWRLKYKNLTTIVNVDHSDEKRVQMGQKSSSLRNLGIWHIIRSALRCFTTINYVSLFKVVHVDQSDEKRCQNVSTLGNPGNIASVSN